jgi:hypothetical protein
LSDVIQSQKCRAKNTLESSIKNISRLDSLLRPLMDFIEATGIKMIEAIAKR